MLRGTLYGYSPFSVLPYANAGDGHAADARLRLTRYAIVVRSGERSARDPTRRGTRGGEERTPVPTISSAILFRILGAGRANIPQPRPTAEDEGVPKPTCCDDASR